MWSHLVNPFVWIQGVAPHGWEPGLETFWPVLVESILVSLALALIGCWLVVRGLSLLGDALAHSVLPGIVIGFLIGRSLQSAWILIGATLMGLAATTLVQGVHGNSRVKEDASLGIVFTTLFAIGVVLIDLYAGQSDLDPGCVLYGQLEWFIITRQKVLPMCGILLTLLVLGAVFYRHLLVSTFDPLLARSMHIPATWVHYGLMAVLSLTTVASFEAVGAILAVALLITPGATARLWTDRMPTMLLIAAAHAVAASLLGYWLSHPALLNTSASGAVSTAGFALFLGSWLVAPRRGLLNQWQVRRRLQRRMADENLIKTVAEISTPAEGASQVAVSQSLQTSEPELQAAIRRCVSREWLSVQGGQISLTATGQRHAERLAKAHLLWEQYLKTEVGLADDHLHEPAEWVEHYLNEDRLAELERPVG